MLRSLLVLAAGLLGVLPASAETGVAAVLDDFHQAASVAAGERYFGHFAADAIFLGTDPGERWTLAEFRDFAEPYFSRGQGWTYSPVERHVVVDTDGRLAWFDELLDNDSYGRCRGTGVLRRTGEGWKVVQYNLTLVVPNGVAREVARVIREAGGPPAEVDDAPASSQRFSPHRYGESVFH